MVNISKYIYNIYIYIYINISGEERKQIIDKIKASITI